MGINLIVQPGDELAATYDRSRLTEMTHILGSELVSVASRQASKHIVDYIELAKTTRPHALDTSLLQFLS